MATFDAAYHILVNIVEVSLKWLGMSFEANECQTLHNTGSHGAVWPDLVSIDQVSSRI